MGQTPAIVPKYSTSLQSILETNASAQGKPRPDAYAPVEQQPSIGMKSDSVELTTKKEKPKRNIGDLFASVFAGTIAGGAAAVPVTIGSTILMKSTVDAGSAIVGAGHMGLAIGLIGGTLTGLIVDGLYENPTPAVGARYGGAIGMLMGAALMQGRLGMAAIPTAIAGAIIGGAAGAASGYQVIPTE